MLDVNFKCDILRHMLASKMFLLPKRSLTVTGNKESFVNSD